MAKPISVNSTTSSLNGMSSAFGHAYSSFVKRGSKGVTRRNIYCSMHIFIVLKLEEFTFYFNHVLIDGMGVK